MREKLGEKNEAREREKRKRKNGRAVHSLAGWEVVCLKLKMVFVSSSQFIVRVSALLGK